MEKLGFHWTEFYEIWYLYFFRKSVEIILVSIKSDKNNVYFTLRSVYIMIISRSALLKMKNSSDKFYTEKTPILYSIVFFFFKNRAVYEIMWKNIVGLNRPQMTIRRMRIACWIRKSKTTHSECVILIAFPLQ